VAALSAEQVEGFIAEGFVRLDDAFPRTLAEEARAILWRDMGLSPDEPAGWTQPVVRLGMYGQPCFVAAASTPRLHQAFDQLVGAGAWRPPASLGTFPVRFPALGDPGDDGWHIDTSFPPPDGDHSDYFQWRANVRTDGRALLLLFLFSDVGPDDARTRIRIGSHRRMARRLAPAGDAGLSLAELAQVGFDDTADLPQALASGPAGTVYLCHPFLVHAAQAHRGTEPRFMAQPPLLPTRRFDVGPAGETAPVVEAIRRALAE
jgi:hypothetical protein